MGLEKRDHIRAIAGTDSVAHKWKEIHGKPFTDEDLDQMFHESVELQTRCVLDYADLIPGTLKAVAGFRARGLKIGSSTGYSRPIMEVLVAEAARRGYTPDSWVCPSDVPAGRPYPWMAYRNAMNLQVYPMSAMLKVGDTVPDIEEGLNAGTWTIGVARTGNELGLSEQEAADLDPALLETRLQQIRTRLLSAGAHYVVDTIADVLPLLDEIEARRAEGERP
jgi:phosphonoacetaldehyde hydrolase